MLFGVTGSIARSGLTGISSNPMGAVLKIENLEYKNMETENLESETPDQRSYIINFNQRKIKYDFKDYIYRHCEIFSERKTSFC